MNISSVQVTSSQEKMTRVWRCRVGAGKYQNSLVLTGNSRELQQVAKAIVFALTGRKTPEVDEATIEFVDNAGDTWLVQRGPFGGRFSQNNRPISVDQAQKSMLAALLDMDVSIGTSEGLVAPLIFRIFDSRQGAFVSRDGLSVERADSREIDAKIVNAMLSEECARLIDRPEYDNPQKLAKIADSLIMLQARWTEVQSAPAPLNGPNAHAPSLSMIETLSRELDHLQHIDFLCKKMGDGNDNLSRLTSQLDALDARLLSISGKWPSSAISLGLDTDRWGKGVELLVRAKGYAKLNDTAVRIRKISSEKLRPIAEAALASWDEFLNGSKGTGQELESCLASTLLGMKQLGLDLDKITESLPMEEPLAREGAGGWFDRLRGIGPRGESVSLESEGTKVHKKWLQRAIQEIDSVKESLDYSLKAVQAFVDVSESSRSQMGRGLNLLEELAQKSSDELNRLSLEWKAWAEEAGLSELVSIDDLCLLACEATEHQVLSLQREAIANRYDERSSMQHQLEVLIRQWWKIIGSDKNVDIKNPAFLVAEARAALRHRDTRRQRVQKIVKDAARHARDESLLQWAHKRKSELQVLWTDVFAGAGLAPLDISDVRVSAVARIGSAIQAMEQMQVIKDEARFAKADIWAEAEQSAVRVYLFDKLDLNHLESKAFVDLAQACPVLNDGTVNLFLIADEPTASKLVAKGFGGSLMISHQGTIEDNPVRVSPAAEAKPRRVDLRGGAAKEAKTEPTARTTSVTKGQASTRTTLSTKAEAALKLLNPKSRD